MTAQKCMSPIRPIAKTALEKHVLKYFERKLRLLTSHFILGSNEGPSKGGYTAFC